MADAAAQAQAASRQVPAETRSRHREALERPRVVRDVFATVAVIALAAARSGPEPALWLRRRHHCTREFVWLGADGGMGHG